MKLRIMLVSIFILLSSTSVQAYDIVEYFSKDVEDFKVYGEYVKGSNIDKNFITIVLVAHIHRDDGIANSKKTIQAFHKIYEALIKDKWIHENRQGKNSGLVSIEQNSNRIKAEIDIDGMDRAYQINCNNNFEERIIRKINKEIRSNGYTGIVNGVYKN